MTELNMEIEEMKQKMKHKKVWSKQKEFINSVANK